MDIKTKYNHGEKLCYIRDHSVQCAEVLGIKADTIFDGDKEGIAIVYKMGFKGTVMDEVNECFCFRTKEELIKSL